MKTCLLLTLLIGWMSQAAASEILLSELTSDLVPSPVKYAVIVPG